MLKNIAVLVSGGGTNLQAILNAQKKGKINSGRVVLVISSNPDAYALERAKNAGIETLVLSEKDYPDPESFDEVLIGSLLERNIELIVLAGYLRILSGRVIERFHGKIINVHPSLIPSFCGKGFYGLRVHKAALDCGVKVTGATVHFVEEDVDTGKIIAQKAVAVYDSDTPEILQQRVMRKAEWILLPAAVERYCAGEISL